MSLNDRKYNKKEYFRINKSINFELGENAFNRDNIRSAISENKIQFNETVLETNNAVGVLDKYDDFAYLKIDPSKYRHESGIYGIFYDESKHEFEEVIFSHQKQAALAFLRELRGFGLLADVVGSGKTYEACMVLSELAARDKIKSMLIIVPDQVFTTWKEVLEIQFGLGKGVLKEVGADLSKRNIKSNLVNGFRVLESPVIVKASDFAKWNDNLIEKLLFDVIVYDEAHNLCDEKPEALESLCLLSKLMQTKKEANKTYCILLSATPHSGNLEQMYKLWYFIRCKGGSPEDFDAKHSGITTNYKKEFTIYKERICRNSVTVMEFIANVKRETILESNTTKYFDEMIEIIKDSEEFFSVVQEKNLSNIDNFRNPAITPIALQNKMINYYFRRADQKNKEEITKAIASAYHNGVLRTIMIRQPKNGIKKSKIVKNIYFYPTKAVLDSKKINGAYETKTTIKVDCNNIDSNKAVYHEGEYMSVDEYCHNVASKDIYVKPQNVLGQLYGSLLAELDGIDGSDIFTKKNSITYYTSQFDSSLGQDETNIVIPVQYTSKTAYDSVDSFENKYKKTAEILRQHKDKRVLIFFDYDLSDKESVVNTFLSRIIKDKEFSGRVLDLVGKKAHEIEAEFNEKEDAIFVVTDSKFTEGANLQKSSVIINFQVTPDPLSMDQRVGRIYRIGQSENEVYIYSLADMHKLEGYVLAYYSRIGLLSSNTGDATIIAGCNNERMVAVRCHKCNKVQLLTQDEYEYEMANDGIYCNSRVCYEPSSPNGTLMEEISIQNFRCDNPECGVYFRRSNEDEGYYCVMTPSGGKGIMVNSTAERGNRTYECRKICALTHCRYLNNEKNGKCAVLSAYKKRNVLFEADIKRICAECISSGKRICFPGCEAYSSINNCINCRHSYSVCKPHKLEFDANWVSPCPKCGTGNIRLIENSTFANYIRASFAFNMDGGESFCENLLNEASKVADIKMILSNDELNN